MLLEELKYAAWGTGFTFLLTVLGAAMVFFFKKDMSTTMHRVFLGFAAGVMTAASVWSLLLPAIERAQEQGSNILLPVGGGFVAGGAFLMLLDGLLPHLHMISKEREGLPASWKRTTMLVLAVTLHNIPEGMAVGLAFSVAVQSPQAGAFAGAAALAIGIGLQNFPEGAAISLPLHAQGMGRMRSFVYGGLSGIVEPIFGLLTVLVAGRVAASMPWILSFAAGAMIYVVAEELIPEANLDRRSHAGTVSIMGGFLVMMLLDVLLG